MKIDWDKLNKMSDARVNAEKEWIAMTSKTEKSKGRVNRKSLSGSIIVRKRS